MKEVELQWMELDQAEPKETKINKSQNINKNKQKQTKTNVKRINPNKQNGNKQKQIVSKIYKE